MKRCDPRAYSQCPDRERCGLNIHAFFTEGSECDDFNQKIIDISVNEPHLVCEVIDVKCHHRWIAVFPEKTLLKQLQCPRCGAVGYVIKSGQDLEEEPT